MLNISLPKHKNSCLWRHWEQSQVLTTICGTENKISSVHACAAFGIPFAFVEKQTAILLNPVSNCRSLIITCEESHKYCQIFYIVFWQRKKESMLNYFRCGTYNRAKICTYRHPNLSMKNMVGTVTQLNSHLHENRRSPNADTSTGHILWSAKGSKSRFAWFFFFCVLP